MLRPVLLSLCAALLVSAAPAAADPGTTGGVPAIEPPALSPQGGVDGPRGDGQATAARAGGHKSDGRAAPSAPPAAASQARTAAASPAAPAGHAAATRPSASATASASSSGGSAGGGGLPRTGFALAALVAIGTGFMLTGYALRYSRGLDS
ncbi:MAG: hypothetical protein ACJ766_17455 [Thermoleophilaceae bacterium]